MSLYAAVLQLLSIPAFIALHELGHYVSAWVFGFKPTLHLNIRQTYVRYVVTYWTPKWQLCVVSFMGVLGLLPIVLVYVVTGDWVWLVVVGGFNFGYSCFELLKRYRSCKELTQ